MQITATMRYNYTSIRMTKKKKTQQNQKTVTPPNTGKNVEKCIIHAWLGEMQNNTATLEDSLIAS